MRMRKHHYELIAKAMRRGSPLSKHDGTSPKSNQWLRDCWNLAHALATQDSDFNRELFLKECGVYEN